MATLHDSYAAGSRDPSPRGSRFGLRISHSQLARTCHNVASSLHAGVDVRRVWELEAQRGSAFHRSKISEIQQRISEGETQTAALRAAGGYFPPLLYEMVEVGERTGRVEQIFFKLADHYDNLVRLRRVFLMGIAWPMFELTLGLAVIGLFIWILGMIAGDGPPPITFLGLYGTRGLLIYSSVLGAIAALLVATMLAVKHGWVNLDPLLRILVHIPGIGRGLRTMAISRLSWAMAMATDSDLDARHAAELAIRTTQNSYYTDHIEGIKRSIRSGSDLHSAFRHTGVFPHDFLDALETGEISGRISEAMHVLAKDYEDRARNYYRGLTVVAGIAVFLLVAGLIILMIFQLFMQYVDILNTAGQI